MIDKRSKVLLYIVGLLVVISISATYYKTMVLHDFEIINDLEEENIIEE